MKTKILSGVLALSLSLGLCACGQPAEPVKPSVDLVAEAAQYTQSAQGNNGVVAAADPVAAAVGLQVLKDGGNAADAAIATAFALSLTENAASGIGGSGFMLYYDASENKSYALDYYYACPANMVAADFKDASLRKKGMGGIRAVVPGFVAGMAKANEMFSTKPLAELIQPTIDLAINGVEVTAFMGETYLDYYDTIMLYPETARVFTDEGLPYGEGSIFKNPDLAKTLGIIAEKGPEGFYTGEVAQAIVDSQRATGSKMTLEDLANYDVVVTQPLESSYRGYKVVTMPPVSGGGLVLSMLNLAEHFDMAAMEKGSAEYLHTWGEIMRLGNSDFSAYFEDPAMYPSVMPAVRGMITKEYAAERIKLFKSNSTMELGPVGNPADFDPESHTTHLSVVDKDGNMVTMTNTHGDFFGTLTTVTDYGFVLQNTTAFSGGVTYQPEPGKRARSPMSPTLIFTEDGKPYAAVGTPGSGRIPTTIALIISNMIDYGMDLKDAVDAPRIYQARNENLTIEGGFDKEAVEPVLKKLGHEMTWRVANDSFFGGAHCVSVDPETGVRAGAADSRRSGVAAAY